MSQYTILKDEKYFEASKRNLLVTAATHDCEEILNGDYKPENNADCRELFEQKQYYMHSIFNKVLQSDMGKAIVRKYAPFFDAQSVWRDFESHMSTSSKGLNERQRLHAYVPTTVYDRYWKGTTEQFVLHFNEQFRQLDEVTPQNEHLPHSVRLTLLQPALRSVPELRNVETIEEYMSLTNSSSGQVSITYDKYFMMLQNPCITYDKNLKLKPSTTSSTVYQHELDDDPSVHDEEDDYMDDNFAPDGIDMPSDDIYNVNNTNVKRTTHVKSLIPRKSPGKSKPNKAIPPKPRYNGPVYFPKHIYNMLSEDMKKELDKYNQEKKSQYKLTHPRMAKVHEQDHEEFDSPDNREPDLENHFHEDSYPMQDSDIEDLLETHGQYSVNMAFTYHILKHSVSSYVSLVDRGADVHILERTGRKVSVTGIDHHQLPGLDIVTCVALIQTNDDKVNMHEYAYYGRSNTIHSPCQIEWFNNTCDDKSHHVGGKQVIIFLDGYATLLECRSGLM